MRYLWRRVMVALALTGIMQPEVRYTVKQGARKAYGIIMFELCLFFTLILVMLLVG